MAKEAVAKRDIAARLACHVFTISHSCFRHEGKKNADNELIANWLLRLSDNNRNWGFGLCYQRP
jgi:putative transposase